MSAIDIAHLQNWVGRQQTIPDDMSPFRAKALAAALDHERALGTGDELPPAWHWLYFLDTPSARDMGLDGHPRQEQGFLPAAALPRRMWAAGALKIIRPIILGTPAEKTSTIKSIALKSGKSGNLVFVTVEHALSQGRELCILEMQDLVYREMPAGPAPAPPGAPAPADADWTKIVTPDPVLLFRYSALTYNSHRIHYDRDYATTQEFYPALVVHGPLLATLLLDLAAQNIGHAQVVDFRFRAVRPSFVTSVIKLSGKRHGDTVELWSSDNEDTVCMTASATLRQG